MTGMFGYFPEACRGMKLFVPTEETLGRFFAPLESVRAVSLVWGWPNRFIELAHRHGTKVYPSGVNTVEAYEKLRELGIDGIMTDRIEVLGPRVARDAQRAQR